MVDIFEDDRSITFSPIRNVDIEFYRFDDGTLSIESREEDKWDSQRVNVVISATDATALKEFLIRRGY